MDKAEKALGSHLTRLGVSMATEYAGTERSPDGVRYRYHTYLSKGNKADPLELKFTVSPEDHHQVRSDGVMPHGLSLLIHEAYEVRQAEWDMDTWLLGCGAYRPKLDPARMADHREIWRRMESNTRKLEQFFGTEGLADLIWDMSA